jgi:carboxyl-terminal processing protease
MDRQDFPGEPVQSQKRGPVCVSLGVLIICILLTAIIIFSATWIGISSYYGRFSELRKLQEIAALYDKNYLYDVDREALSENLAKTYIYGCGDRFASYYSAQEWQEHQASASGNSVGIGVYATVTDEGEIYIARVMEGSPAQRAGLLPGDVVVSIDGEIVKTVGYENAVNLIRGETGSQVMLEVRRGGETLTLPVIRAQYVPQTVYAETVLRDGELYGYVYITEFLSVQTTYKQFKTAVDALIEQGVKGFIFDVRDNSGGDLNAILRILDYLLPEGPIVHMFYAGEKDPITYSSDKNHIDLPMVVLANEYTASAAELFTSALRDYEKAEIIGKKTFGKGCGQSGQMLSDGSVAFITTFLYNPPYSGSYDGVGIFPDHEVALREEWQNKNLFLVPHEEDDQLLKAVDVIASKTADAQS